MSESRFADANVSPSIFVKFVANSRGGRVVPAGVGDIPYGISQPQTRSTIYLTLDDGYCAIQGEAFEVYTMVDKECWLTLGYGGCNAGDFLKPDASGDGIVAGAGDWFGARAKDSGLQGDLVPVDVMIDKWGFTLLGVAQITQLLPSGISGDLYGATGGPGGGSGSSSSSGSSMMMHGRPENWQPFGVGVGRSLGRNSGD